MNGIAAGRAGRYGGTGNGAQRRGARSSMTRTGLLLLMLVGSLGAQQPKAPSRPAPSPRNPAAFHAMQLLEVRLPGVAPRIRFTWEHVPNAKEYVLTGRWTDARSWIVRSQEFRVTARNATRWASDWVTFDVALAEGNHSWQIVAVFAPNGMGDYANPAHVSFEIR